ncbi:MAG: tyrosine-protein phosphatase [Hydrogenophaga sp.]
MIDLHCHLLPGVDDGPATLDEALALARAALDDGITASVVTPHIHPGRYDNRLSLLQTRVQAFRAALQRAGIALPVLLGAEVRVSLESLELLQQGEVPYVGEVRGTRVLLLELPHSHVPPGTQQLVRKLLDQNVRPLLAHPERNKAFMDDPRRLDPLVGEGCWLQLTAGAVVGDFGRAAQRLAHRLLEEDQVRVVASDAHNLAGRAPRMTAAREYIGQHWGADLADELLLHNPLQMVGAALQALPAAAPPRAARGRA